MGTPLREIIYDHGGGIPNGAQAEGRDPGRRVDADPHAPTRSTSPMDFDSVQKAGSILGSAGVIVMDDTVAWCGALLRLAQFFPHESCGQCTPCREGTGWLEQVAHRASRTGGATPATSTCCSTSRTT